MRNRLYQILKWLIILKVGFILLRVLAPFAHPHIIRQTDTMGVAYRYWLRWFVEGDYSLIPAVLTSGDHRGIQSMELPLYNILMAPAFVAGIDFGRPLAQLISFALMSLLTFWAYKLWKTQENEDFDLAFPLMLLFGISSIYYYRFMPDYFSFILVMIGMGYVLNENKARYFPAFCLMGLGLLVKPPAIITMGPLLILLASKHLLRVILKSAGPAFILCVAYYTLGMKYLRSIADQPEYFYTEFRNPIVALFEFLSQPIAILDLLFKSLFGHWTLIPLLLGWIYISVKQKKFQFSYWILILVLQVLAVGSLDGKHAFIHDYYFIGTSFLCSYLVVRFLKTQNNFFQYLLVAIVGFTVLEKMYYEVRPIWNKNQWAECRELKARNPNLPWNQSYVFRSIQGPVPYLGLCFGERQASLTSQYGFFQLNDQIPEDCQIIDNHHTIRLVECKQN